MATWLTRQNTRMTISSVSRTCFAGTSHMLLLAGCSSSSRPLGSKPDSTGGSGRGDDAQSTIDANLHDNRRHGPVQFVP